MIVDSERVERLSKVFEEVGLEGVRVFEELDRQLVAAKMINEKCGSLTPHIMFTNALVSYQLSIPGEEYWLNLAQLVVEECPNSYEEVLDRTFYILRHLHKFAVKAKEKRLNKLKMCIYLYDSISHEDLNTLRGRVARCLGANVDDKTIVFAIKMLYYGMKAVGINVEIPFNIPIPVDRRIIKISYLSGLIISDELGRNTSHLNEVLIKLFKKPQIVRDAWNAISFKCRIPPLRLDTVLWFFGRYVNSASKADILRRLIYELGSENISRINLNNVKLLINELFYRMPLTNNLNGYYFQRS